ncbi:MAG: GxGYxYP family putative glycoside hydrolase [Crenarchaeota archaeon]|nr:GxGYxYP family putative glycoside hydrolase [Thermoproteota archaeon]
MKDRIFPAFKKPGKLKVLDVRPYSWHEQMTIVCAQGLINRVRPRVYLVFDDYVDRLWLSIYRKRYRVKHEETNDLYELLSLFRKEIAGFVVYDDNMLHSANVAMTYGGIHNAIPASPEVAERLSEIGFRKVADLRGKWGNRLEAYEWAFQNLMQQCNRRIVGSMCVDPPLTSFTNKHHVRDYLVAVKAFSFDLSTKIRDRREVELFDRILSSFDSLGVVLGWHCIRDLESEAVARASRNGFFVLCNLHSPNLTVHSGIKTNFKFKQKHASKVTLEDKVYVAFVQSDGDAIWAMNNFQNLNWLDGQRGRFPYTWEVQPLLLELAPGMLEHYYRTATSNDYLIAGPSGAGYTAPSVNKRLDEFLDHTRRYMEACDLKSILIMNRNPRVAYQELEDPRIPEAFAKKLENCYGFLHGYAGSTFEPTVFVNNTPYVHTTLYASASTDILKELKRLIENCETRPLFVSIHVREEVKMPVLRSVIEKLDRETYKVMKIDGFMLALKKAHEKGLFKQAFSESVREALKENGKTIWENYYRRVERLEKLVEMDEQRMLKEYDSGGYGFTIEELPDLLAYDAVETALRLVQAALNIKGVYVNNIEKSVEDFLKEYSEFPDTQTVKTIFETWKNWEKARISMEEARMLARRVIGLAKSLGGKL